MPTFDATALFRASTVPTAIDGVPTGTHLMTTVWPALGGCSVSNSNR